MATYADLVTLLFCFFVLLYAISNVDSRKFTAMASALSNSYPESDSDTIVIEGIGDMLGNGIIHLPAVESSDAVPSEANPDIANAPNHNIQDMIMKDLELESFASELKTYFESNGFENKIDLEYNDFEINIRFKDGVLFDPGDANIKPEAIDTLSFIADRMLNFQNNDIEIEGHTDSTPMTTPEYKDNWFLSAARAINVGKFFIDEKGFSPSRISASGRGEYMPIAPNDTPENKAKNRRVEIKIKSSNNTENKMQ